MRRSRYSQVLRIQSCSWRKGVVTAGSPVAGTPPKLDTATTYPQRASCAGNETHWANGLPPQSPCTKSTSGKRSHIARMSAAAVEPSRLG